MNNDFEFIIKTCDICKFKFSNFCLKNGIIFKINTKIDFLVCDSFEFNMMKLERLYGIDSLKYLKKEVS